MTPHVVTRPDATRTRPIYVRDRGDLDDHGPRYTWSLQDAARLPKEKAEALADQLNAETALGNPWRPEPVEESS